MLSSPSAPTAPDAAAADAADAANCRELLRNGSRTFLAASFLLPRRVREPASALYAFCRLADDAVDMQAAEFRSAAVGRLHRRLDRLYAGDPFPVPADRALAGVVRRFHIPQALLEALLDGFDWDAHGRQYEDLESLHAYAARVAGSVGAMMALLMGVREPHAIARACDLGVAMQLSNIARDVGEDARAGRLYLPRRWLHEAGIDPDAWLAAPCHTPALGSVVQRLLDEADRLYARVGQGVARLPLACRPGINAARLMYADIGHEVARRGLDSVGQRAVVPASRKAALLPVALLGLWPASTPTPPPALEATRFLVDAVVAQPWPDAVAGAGPSWWHLRTQYVGVIELFERLERRDRGGMSGAAGA